MWRAVGLAVLVVVGGCGGSSSKKTAAVPSTAVTAASSSVPPSTTTSTADVVKADEGLVRDELYLESQAWSGGPDAGVDAMLAGDYPPLVAEPAYRATRADCLRRLSPGGGQLPAHFRVDVVMDEGSFRAVPGFTLPSGPLKGKPLDGRLYSFTATSTSSADGMAPQVTKETEHATVLGGRAFLFVGCAQ